MTYDIARKLKILLWKNIVYLLLREGIKNFVDIIFLIFIKISIFNGYVSVYTFSNLFSLSQASFVM